jgi:ABC-2 type transport system permease protein
MRRLRTIWIVTKWEFTTTVLRTSFLVVLFSLPIVHIGIAALLGLSLRTATSEPKSRAPIAVVDEPQLLTDVAGSDIVLRDRAAALRGLSEQRFDGVYVLSSDYLQTGRVDVYERPAADLLQIGKTLANRERAATVIRRGLTRQADARAERLVDPLVRTTVWRVEGATVERRIAPAVVDVLAGPFGMCFIMGLSIFLASGLLQQAMSTELQNRMLEVMLSVVTPLQLLTGKVVGLSAAGLLQAVVYLAITVGVAPLIGGVTISWSLAAWSAAIFLAGYLLFAVLMAGTGALARDPQEVPQLATLWMLLAALPFFFITHISADPGSWIARALTWVPPTAPVALLLRMATGGVGAERIPAIAGVLIFALLSLHLSARLFGARVHSGGQLSLRGVFWK